MAPLATRSDLQFGLRAGRVSAVRVLRRWWWAVATLGVLTAYQVLPGPGSATTRIPVASVGEADSTFTLWVLRSAASNLLHRPGHLLYGNIFWPRLDALAFADTLLGYAPLYGIASRLTGSRHALAYNLVLYGGYLAGGLAVVALARWFGCSRLGALLAGVVFSTLPYRSAEVVHLHLTASWLVVLALLAVMRWLETGRRRWALLAGVLAGCTWHVSVYFAIVLTWALLWFGFVWVARRRHRGAVGWSHLQGAGLAGAAAGVIVAPSMGAYLAIQRGGWLARPVDQIIRLHIAQLPPSTFYRALGRAGGSPAGPDSLLPGVLVLVLFAAAVVAVLARRAGRARPPGDVPLRNESVALDRDRRAAFALPLTAAALACAVLAIGPGHGLLSEPFLIMRHLPGLRSVREPTRFAIVPLLAGAVLIAAFVDGVLRGHRARRIALAALIVAVPAEVLYRPRTMPITSTGVTTEAAAVLRRLPPGVVFEAPMPTSTVQLDAATSARMVASLDDGQPRVIGFSGGLPSEVPPVFEAGRAFPSPASLVRLRERDITYVVLHGSASGQPCSDAYGAAEMDALVARLRASPTVASVERVGHGAVVVFVTGLLRPAEEAVRFDPLPPVIRDGERCPLD